MHVCQGDILWETRRARKRADHNLKLWLIGCLNEMPTPCRSLAHLIVLLLLCPNCCQHAQKSCCAACAPRARAHVRPLFSHRTYFPPQNHKDCQPAGLRQARLIARLPFPQFRARMCSTKMTAAFLPLAAPSVRHTQRETRCRLFRALRKSISARHQHCKTEPRSPRFASV